MFACMDEFQFESFFELFSKQNITMAVKHMASTRRLSWYIVRKNVYVMFSIETHRIIVAPCVRFPSILCVEQIPNKWRYMKSL